MLEVERIIDDLNSINERLGFKHSAVENAIKVLKMWKQLEKDYGQFDLKEKDGMSDIPLVARMRGIEMTFFPTIIHQTLKVAIQGKSDEQLHHIRKTIKNTWGVVEVRL